MTFLFELYCYVIMCHRLGDNGDSFIIAVNDSIIDGYSHRLINDDDDEAIEAYSRILMIDCVASMVYSCIIIIMVIIIIIIIIILKTFITA